MHGYEYKWNASRQTLICVFKSFLCMMYRQNGKYSSNQASIPNILYVLYGFIIWKYHKSIRLVIWFCHVIVNLLYWYSFFIIGNTLFTDFLYILFRLCQNIYNSRDRKPCHYKYTALTVMEILYVVRRSLYRCGVLFSKSRGVRVSFSWFVVKVHVSEMSRFRSTPNVCYFLPHNKSFVSKTHIQQLKIEVVAHACTIGILYVTCYWKKSSAASLCSRWRHIRHIDITVYLI